MKGFEKLLNTVRKNAPDLISEQAANEMLSDYQTSIDQLQNDAYANGKAAGFEEGYREGMEKQKIACQQELDELLAKCDEDATNKLETIIRTLNEDHANKLQEVYDTLCQNMVPLADVQAMDADHAAKFETALNAIDAQHADQLATAVESVTRKFDDEASKKLLLVDKKYRSILKESAARNEALAKSLKNEKERKLDLLAESVEKYLNYALQEAIPTKKLVSEAKYIASQKALEKITSILKINNILQESKDGVFQDYEDKIKKAEEAQNKLMVENANLKDSLRKKEARLLLESKIAKCTPAEAAFLRTYFSNAKSADVIEEQIGDARAAYSRLHSEKRAAAVASVKTATASPSELVTESKKPVKKEEPVKKVVTESATKPQAINGVNKMSPFMAAYAEMLKNNNN